MLVPSHSPIAQVWIVAFRPDAALIEWLRPATTAIGLTISILANYLLFTRDSLDPAAHEAEPPLPAERRIHLLAAIGFEILKTPL